MPFIMTQDSSRPWPDVHLELPIDTRLRNGKPWDEGDLPACGKAVKPPRRWTDLIGIGGLWIISQRFAEFLRPYCPEELLMHKVDILSTPRNGPEERREYTLIKVIDRVACIDLEQSGGRDQIEVRPNGDRWLSRPSWLPGKVYLRPGTFEHRHIWEPADMVPAFFVSDELAESIRSNELTNIKLIKLSVAHQEAF